MQPLCAARPRRFFELFDDVYVPGRWHLGSPLDDDGNEVDDFGHFTQGHAVEDPGPLWILQDVPGRPLDYSLAGLNVPVLHARVADVFASLAPEAVQLFPVRIEHQPEPYFILVATRRIRCIDEQASRITRWAPENGVPDMVGEYLSIRNLHLDKRRVGAAHVFRPEGWEVDLIVSQEIRSALEHLRATGVKFLSEV